MNNERFTFLKGARAMALTLFALCAMGVSQTSAQICHSGNVTLDEATCQAMVLLDDIADGATSFHVVKLLTPSEHAGAPVDPVIDGPSVIVTTPGLYKYQIDDENGCWNEFLVEDKSGPKCIAGSEMPGAPDALPNIYVSCTFDGDLEEKFTAVGASYFMDCSGLNDDDVIFNTTKYNACDLEEIPTQDGEPLVLPATAAGWEVCEIIVRKHFIADWDGNLSEESANCNQYLYVLRPTVITPPSTHVTGYLSHEDDCEVDFGDTPQNPYFTDLGEDYWGSGEIEELVDGEHYCKWAFQVTEGDPIYTCTDKDADNTKTYKKLRELTIINWCPADGAVKKQFITQLVEVKDNEGPVVDKPVVTEWSNAYDCNVEVRIDPTKAWDCTEYEMDGSVAVIIAPEHGGYAGGSFETRAYDPAAGISIPGVPAGATVRIIVNAWDACGNLTPDTTNHVVVGADDYDPVCVTDDDLIVALVKSDVHGSDVHTIGARVKASSVDEGSWDNCGEVVVLVRPVATGQKFNNNPHDADTELYSYWNDYIEYSFDSGDGFDDKCERVEWVDLLAYVDINDNGTFDDGDQFSICATRVTLFDASKPELTFEECASYKCTDHDAATFGGPQGVWNPTGDACTDIVYGDPVPESYHCPVEVTCGDKTIWAIGEITRTVTVTKWVGHSLFEKEFTQTIYEEVVEDTEIILPADVKVECGTAMVDAPIVVNSGCSEWFVSEPEISDFTNSSSDGSGTCGVLVYEYEFINKCRLSSYEMKYKTTVDRNGAEQQMGRNGDIAKAEARSLSIMKMDGTTTTVPVNNANLVDGYFRYIQYVTITDSEDPTAEFESTPGCEVVDGCLGGTGVFTLISLSDECTDASIVEWYINDNDGDNEGFTANADLTVFTGSGLAKGTYTLHAHVADQCGNSVWVSEDVTVTWDDCKKPTVIASSGFTTLMPENCEVEIWVSDLVESVDDNCSDDDYLNANLSIELLTDANNDGNINNLDASAERPTATNVTIGTAGTSLVAVWIIDEEDNVQLTVVPVGVVDNGDCSGGADEPDMGGAAAAVAGKITNEADEMVDGVTIDAKGSSFDPFFGLYDGTFNLSIPMNADVTVTPSKDANHLNGVSGRDLVLLQRHVLGIQELTSAYKLIAADVNADDKVNTRDMADISKLILGIYDAFPKVSSWRFVDKAHTFVNPTSPWGFPEAINYANLSADAQADFIGVKMGDISGNAKANNLLGDDNMTVGAMTIAIDDVKIAAGETHEIAFTAKDFNDFAGYQFSIQLADGVTFQDVALGALPNHSEGNFGFNNLDAGVITTNWVNASSINLADGAVLFTVTVSADRDMNVSQAIAINSSVTTAEAYNNDLDAHSVKTFFNRVESNFALFQNTPNPFSSETIIGFELPTAGAASLKVMDVSGRVLLERNGTYTAGVHQIILNKSDLGATGVLYYQLDTDAHTATKKMVILD